MKFQKSLSVLTAWCIIGLLACTLSRCGRNDSGAPQPATGKYDEFIRNPQTAQGPIDSINVPILTFDQIVQDFGEVTEGDTIFKVFTYKNTGKTPLILSSASSSCGCTVPKVDDSPLEPGGTSELVVRFNSKGREGIQDKTIVVNANTLKGKHNLRIKGTVVPKN